MARWALLAATTLCAVLAARTAWPCDSLSGEIGAAVEAGNFIQAERLGQAALAAQPDAPGPRLELARVYGIWAQQLAPRGQQIEITRSARALELLAEVVDRWPELRQPYACLLELQLLRAEDEPFLTALAHALQRFPAPDAELMGALESLVGQAVKQERSWLSERMCTLLVERKDLTVPALSNCGLVAVRSEDLELARTRLARARMQDPRDALVAHNLAVVEVLLGELAAAQGTLEAIALLEPQNLEPVLQLAAVRTAREPARSASIWREVVARCDALPAHELAKPLRAFAQGVADALAKEKALSIRGLASSLLEEHAALAAALLGAEAGRQPDDPTYPFHQAEALERAGFPARAFDALERAARLAAQAPAKSPIDAGHIDLQAGRVAVKLGRHADAIAHLERARSATEDVPNVEYLLGLAYAEVGDRAAAEREYAACLKRERNTAEMQHWCRKGQAALAALPAAPGEPSEEFEAAVAKANANEAGAGGAYVKSAVPAIAPSLAAAVRSCIPSASGSAAGPRQLAVRVAADGSVSEVLQARTNTEPLCFAKHLRTVKLPAPPGPDWWLAFTIQIEK